MVRGLAVILILLCSGFFVLKIYQKESHEELPVYLLADTISENHETQVNVFLHTIHRPDSFEMEVLKRDYANIWAHLNYVFATNDVTKGKEYFTEDWFKHIAQQKKVVEKPFISRIDLSHNLHIHDWAWDGLVCDAIDSNAVFVQTWSGGSQDTLQLTIGVVLLYQGNHWRIDAMRVIADSAKD